MATLCLSMIVRDEAAVIERCLASVRPYISHWVVADTGSTDDTPALVERALSGIPGRLLHHEWRDFGHNRTLALAPALASGADYVLSIDADEVWSLADPAVLDVMSAQAYAIPCHAEGEAFIRMLLLRADLPWRYAYAFHEVAECGLDYTWDILRGARVDSPQDGRRSADPVAKLQRDLGALRRLYDETPDDPRITFYFALAAANAGSYREAMDAFANRLTMVGSNQLECWYAHYRMGVIEHSMGNTPKAVWHLYEAYAMAPDYIEPIYWLGRLYLAAGSAARALPLLELAANKPTPEPLLFIEERLYAYEAMLYLTLCLRRLGLEAEEEAVAAKLLLRGTLPEGAYAAAVAALDGAHMETGT